MLRARWPPILGCPRCAISLTGPRDFVWQSVAWEIGPGSVLRLHAPFCVALATHRKHRFVILGLCGIHSPRVSFPCLHTTHFQPHTQHLSPLRGSHYLMPPQRCNWPNLCPLLENLLLFPRIIWFKQGLHSCSRNPCVHLMSFFFWFHGGATYS